MNEASRTNRCSRRLPASARASLPLPAAADAGVDMTSNVKGSFGSQSVSLFMFIFYTPGPSEETEPVITTVDHADIRGLGTT